MKKINEYKPLAELYDIRPEDYSDINVIDLPFSIRVLNRFEQENIFTVKDLLLVNINFLKSIPGFGSNCLSQVFSYCEKIADSKNRKEKKKINNFSNLIINNRDAIALGDFSFAESRILSEKQEQQLNNIKEAYDIVGGELVLECMCSPEKIYPILSAFSTFSAFVIRNKNRDNLEKIFYQIPSFRKNNCAKNYINTFSYDDNTRDALAQCYASEDEKLESILETINTGKKTQVELAEKFLNWCAFDLKKEIALLFEKIYTSPRIQTIIEGRANDLTLNELGEKLGITRERVRQIELKAKKVFIYHQSIIKIMPKIFADQNGYPIITLETIRAISGEHSAALIYLLKGIKNRFVFDQILNVFVFGEKDLSSEIQYFIDTLPDILHKSDIQDLFEIARKDYGFEKKYVEQILFEEYDQTGDVLHRSRLSLAKVYDSVLQKYYSSGIHVYDDNEIDDLRQHIYNEYGDINLPSSNRAVAARISGVCMLAGRGIYISKKDKLISPELAQKMLSFIMDSESPVLLIGTVFSFFEEELKSEGIDNRYYLQGILKELFGKRLFFRRDYVSRDKGFTSIYSSIVSFIKNAKYPVRKEELKTQFKGISDIVISFAISDSDVLNYFGEYLHGSNLVIRETEKEFLSEYLASTLADAEAHHIKDIYADINAERPELFSRNAAVAPYSAFSVLEYLFRDQFQFSRPYVALNNVEIGLPNERLHELLYSMDKFSVSDITEFAKENHMQIQALIEYINSLNDKYLLLDVNTLVSIDEIGINEDIANEVEARIFDEIVGTIPIRDLHCVSKFPHINVLWTEWLVYSVLKKWSKRIDVALSSSQLRQSIPLVSKVGDMDISPYKDLSPEPVRIKVDNMDDIDDLLTDILSDELLEDLE